MGRPETTRMQTILLNNLNPPRFTEPSSSASSQRSLLGGAISLLFAASPCAIAATAPAPGNEQLVSAAASSDPERYTISLISSHSGNLRQTRPVPATLQDLPLFTSEEELNGKITHFINLGKFASLEDAQKALQLIRGTYPTATIHERRSAPPQAPAQRRTSTANVEQTLVATTAQPPSAPNLVLPSQALSESSMEAAAPAQAEQTSGSDGTGPSVYDLQSETLANRPASEMDNQAAVLLKQANEALAKGDNETAIQTFNQLLLLPPNKYSQEAQELIGVARERAGQIAKAKAEYDLYLKLYTQGEGPVRVRQRLAGLSSAKPVASGERKIARRKVDDTMQTTVYGSLSQFYYHGASHVDTTTITGSIIDNATLTAIDQSALITNFDITGRFRNSEYDNRIVFRDTHTANFLEGQPNRNRTTSAYFDIKNKPDDYSIRAGRQPSASGGVLNRFDGVLAGYGFMPKWRINGVFGAPAESTLESKRLFYGASVDAGTFAEHWSGSAYAIQQDVESIVDRRAVGGELRYFDQQGAIFSLIDYDISYQMVNIALFQGNWLSESGTSYNLLLDRRKTPTMATTNALIGETTTSIKTLLETKSEEEIRDLAQARTATSTLFSVGVTKPIHTKWQVGGDFRIARTSGMPATGSLPETPDSGREYTYTAQAIGSDIFTTRDVSVFSLSYIDSNNFKGQALSVSNRSIIRDKWTLDASLRLYAQKDNAGNRLQRISPTLKAAYQWKEKMSFEFETGLENTETNSATQQEKTDRRFYSLGYRWDY